MKVDNLFLSKNKKGIFLFLFISISIQASLSQVFPIKNISTDEGLPHSSIFCVYQDSRDQLWLGSDGVGLIMFDGLKYKVFDMQDGLPGNIVRSLFEDKTGNLWIGTDNGIAWYSGRKFHSGPDSLNNTTVLDFDEDKDGNIWVATNNRGVYLLQEKDTGVFVSRHITKENGLLSNLVMDIEIDRFGKTWLAMFGGINIVNPDFSIGFLEKGFELPSDFILTLHIDDNDKLWCGSYDAGAFIIPSVKNYKTEKTISLTPISKLDKRIWDITETSDGKIWFATDNHGVIEYANNSKILHYTENHGLVSNQILDIVEDREGNLWFASITNGISQLYGKHFLFYNESSGILSTKVNALGKFDDNTLLAGTDKGLIFANFTEEEIHTKKVVLGDKSITSIDIEKENIWVGTQMHGLIRLNSEGKTTKIFSKANGLADDYINCIEIDQYNKVWVGTKAGICIIGNDFFTFDNSDGLINNEVQDLIVAPNGKMWIATLDGLAFMDKGVYRDFDEEEGLYHKRLHSIALDSTGNVWIGTYGGGVFIYDQAYDTIKNILMAPVIPSNNINSIGFVKSNVLFVSTDKGLAICELDKDNLGSVTKTKVYDGSSGFLKGSFRLNAQASIDEEVWFGTEKGITRYRHAFDKKIKHRPIIYIKNVRLFNQNVDWDSLNVDCNWFGAPNTIKLKYDQNHLTFNYSAISLANPDKLKYRYMMEGIDKDWSPYTTEQKETFSGLNNGSYVFKVKAIDQYGNESNVASIPVDIAPPFWERIWFFIFILILVFILFNIYSKYKTLKLKKEKEELTRIVDERTQEIRKQKDEIQFQRDQIQDQKQELTDSIEYAKRIQSALLPAKEIIDNEVENFLLFEPKDIVSGDFYWFSKVKGKLIVAISDCTGHGVPGAFMSMLGIRFLNEIVIENQITRPDIVLNKLRNNVIQSLGQKGRVGEAKDGMDISLCSIDIERAIIQWSGANNSLYLVREKELIEYKADRMPVAIHEKMQEFSLQEIELKNKDCLYLYTDGYVDQFGGKDGKKFKKLAFKRLLLKISENNMQDQYKIMKNTFDEWKQGYEQIDDVSVLGIKI